MKIVVPKWRFTLERDVVNLKIVDNYNAFDESISGIGWNYKAVNTLQLIIHRLRINKVLMASFAKFSGRVWNPLSDMLFENCPVE